MGSGAKTTGKRQGHSSKRYYSRLREIKNRIKDDELKMDPEKRVLQYDEDLPGGGQFYCLYCDKHFMNKDILEEHCKSKIHKKYVKNANLEQYNQTSAEAAAGKTKEVYVPVNRNENGLSSDVV